MHPVSTIHFKVAERILNFLCTLFATKFVFSFFKIRAVLVFIVKRRLSYLLKLTYKLLPVGSFFTLILPVFDRKLLLNNLSKKILLTFKYKVEIHLTK